MNGDARTVDRFDAALEAWLDDVPQLSADRLVGEAIDRVAVTGQQPASWLPWRGASSRRRTLMWLAPAAALAALAIAIGLTSRPGPEEVGSTRHTFTDLGFSVELPDEWVATDTDSSSVARFATDDGGLVAVSVGQAIPDGGRWMMCDEGACGQRMLPNHVPFDRAQSLQELTIAVQLSVDPDAFQSPDYELPEPEVVSLDGEVAYLRAGEVDGRRRTYVYTIRGQQPVVIFYGATPAGFDEGFLSDLVGSFAWAGGSQSTPDSSTFRDYVNRTAGFAMSMPTVWEETEYPGNIGPYPGVARFGYAANSLFRYGALTVSIGTADGRIYLCEVGGCAPTIVRTLDDIERAIEANPSGGLGRTVHEQAQLGREPARVETIEDLPIGATPGYHVVYAFRDGRPVVLMFDLQTLGSRLISEAQVQEMLESFALTD